ncbi:hypothetical protein ACQP1S_19180 [Micromonospora matsumotoense]|uniref:hypothetical protein n=1 Tax=Micromonospora matsumotoense TaxID=121616 RepID=UPI003D8F81B7
MVTAPESRLSPGVGFWGVEEDDVPELYAALLTELAAVGPAYVHLEATTDEEVLRGLREVWPGTLIMNPVLPMGPRQTDRAAADRWLGWGADLISFGRACLANPIWSSGSGRGCRWRRTTRRPGTRAATPAISRIRPSRIPARLRRRPGRTPARLRRRP